MKTYCKRMLCLVLILVSLLTLSTGALAADTAVVSNQKLNVDGESAPVTAYNIDGYNYFKLRDVAYLLNGTSAQFSVDYDEKSNSIRIVTGGSYKVNGSEMHPIGSGNQDAVKSSQTLFIDGRRNSSLSAYNINGYNYFKLRDLGGALGFGVDYNEKTNTILITTGQTAPEPSAAPAETPANWDPDISFTTVDMEGNTWTDACFAGHKLTVLNLWAYWCGPCVGEMPDLEKLAEAYADKGVQMLGVYYEDDESENIRKAKDLGITYSNLRYTSEFDAYLYTGYIPTTVFVDGNGKVLGEAYVGSRSYSSWASIIEGYLG